MITKLLLTILLLTETISANTQNTDKEIINAIKDLL